MSLEQNEVRTAINKAGGVTRVANLCGVSGSCVYKWLHGLARFPWKQSNGTSIRS